MMKTTFLLPVLSLLLLFGCKNDKDLSVPKIEGLSLYWDHFLFGDPGRGLRFEAYTTNKFDNNYDLEFSTSIEEKSITVRYVRSVDNGECPVFPKPGISDDAPYKCSAAGSFYLPEKDLENGVYSLTIVTPYFEVTSEMTVTNEKVTLGIPENQYLTSSIENVHPVPPGLLLGSIVYQGSDNTQDAKRFLDHLASLGLTETTLPDYLHQRMNLDENGRPVNSSWAADQHSIGLLYDMQSVDFRKIFDESKSFFDQTNLNIYLYTSNGDEGRMSQAEGVHVRYAP